MKIDIRDPDDRLMVIVAATTLILTTGLCVYAYKTGRPSLCIWLGGGFIVSLVTRLH